MASNCSPISASIAFDCAAPLLSGAGDTLILLPYDDIDRTLSTIDATNKSLMTNLVMKATKYGYKVEGVNFSNDVDVALAKTKYFNEYEHNIMFRIFKIDPTVKDWIEKLGHTRVCAIVENKVSAANLNHKWEIFGWDLGLEVLEMTRNQSDAETKGAYVIKIGCDETNKESKLPLTVFKTDATTTATMIAALTQA